jgi:hypothetical protein
MKKWEWLAMAGAVLVVCSQLGHLLVWNSILQIRAEDLTKVSAQHFLTLQYMMLVRGLVTLAVHVGIAAWMLQLTTGHVVRPRLWSLCGFLFGLAIPVFYYFTRIIHDRWPRDRRITA